VRLEFEYHAGLERRLRAADRIQLEAILRTQERLFRDAGIDDATAARLVEECRQALRAEPSRHLVWGRSLPDLFEELAGETCQLAEALQQSLPTEPEADEHDFERVATPSDEEAERRERARRILRVSVKALAAAAAVGIGLVATPMVGIAARASCKRSQASCSTRQPLPRPMPFVRRPERRKVASRPRGRPRTT
jgi:hypothetical protein